MKYLDRFKMIFKSLNLDDKTEILKHLNSMTQIEVHFKGDRYLIDNSQIFKQDAISKGAEVSDEAIVIKLNP